MYTLRITDENAVIGNRSTIMEKSNCVDEIQIIVNKLYKAQVDISDATIYMKYVLPVSHKIKMTRLTLSETDEVNAILYYKIPVTAYIAAEPGDIEVSFTFIKLVHDELSNTTTSYIRKTESGIIHITPLAQFDTFEPSEMFTEIDQRLIAMEARQKDLQSLSQAVYDNMATDIKLDKESKKVTLINSNGDIGDGITVPDLSSAIAEELTGVDPDGNQDGVVHVDKVPEANVYSLDKLLK